MTGCLDGVRVLELARFQAGPRAGMLFGDLGADVIKIEPPGGEETRRMPPVVRGQSVYFSVYNRGKRSVCLDLRRDEGKRVLADLVRVSDIVLENFRPGVIAAMGFGYEALRALNARIILLSVSGFGQHGPYRDRPAFDSLGQAMSGLMTLTGKTEGRPVGTASSVVDRYTALHATIGALAALRHRDRTGEGQVVDVCLLDSALTMVEIPTSYYLATGQEGGEGGRPPYRARDGWVVISAAARDMAARLMKIVDGDAAGRRAASPEIRAEAQEQRVPTREGRADSSERQSGSPGGRAYLPEGRADLQSSSRSDAPEGRSDAPEGRSASPEGRSASPDDTPMAGSAGTDARRARLEGWCAAHTVQEICARLEAEGIPVAPVRSIAEVARDPHLSEREMLVKVPDPVAGEMYLPGPTIKFSKTPARVGPVPTPGQHTDDVLMRLLGYDTAAVGTLRRTGAIA